MTTDSSYPPAKQHVIPLGIGLIVVLAFVGLFSSALHDPSPRGVKVGVVAGAGEVDQLQQRLDLVVEHGFVLERYADEQSASAALATQEVQGVYMPDAGSQPQLFIASADGFAVSDLVKAVFGNLAGESATISDLAPLPARDSKGVSAFFAVAGATVGSLIFSAALFLLLYRTSARRRFALISGFSVLAGIVAAFATPFAAYALEARFWAVAGILALVSAATALTATGVLRLVGAPGVGMCVVGLAFLSLPASGGPIGFDFLPAGYQAIAQGLPSTSGVSALRGALYFDGAGTLLPVLVLVGWALGGIALYTLGTVVRRSHPHPPMMGVSPAQAQILRLTDVAA